MKIFLILPIIIALLSCSSASKKDNYIDRDSVNSAIKSKKDDYVRCFDHFMQIHPGFEGGKVQLQWDINTLGRAENIQVLESNIKDERLEQCFAKVITTIQFPKNNGEKITIKYPFNFSNN